MIKIVPRATIPDEFVDLIVDISVKKVKAIQLEVDAMDPYWRQFHLKKVGTTISRLISIARRDPQVIDQLKTTLRSLPYVDYEVIEKPIYRQNQVTYEDDWMDTLYLYGLTKPVTVENTQSQYIGPKSRLHARIRRPEDYAEVVKERWDMGPYQIYLPVEAFFSSIASLWQFIPDRMPTVWARTPHHKAGSHNASEPKFWKAETCWGSFGSVMTTLQADADIPETFRTLYFYVTRYNPGSVYSLKVSQEAYPFARPLPV